MPDPMDVPAVYPPAAWLQLLNAELRLQLDSIMAAVNGEEREGQLVLPPAVSRFAALQALTPQQVRVVIVGQDPYPTPGNAHGLAFSVQSGTRIPASLRNIFKEIASDTAAPSICAGDGCLMPWAEQGVLLLNTTLSVRAGAAGSHEKLGWSRITSAWLEALGRLAPDIVFLLWGGHAQRLAEVLPGCPHILTSVHPSPLSAYRGFFGCRHFSKANRLLQALDQSPIRW